MSASSAPSTTNGTKSNGHGVHVVVRIRPMHDHEGKLKCVRVSKEDKKKIFMRDPRNPNEEYQFNLDAAYDEDATQEELFTNEIDPYLYTVLLGFNTTVFAYGITGSGKTHTMQGTDEKPGIIPRTITRILEIVKSEEESERMQFEKTRGSKNNSNNNDEYKSTYSVSVSYLEIYNEKVCDLLNTNNKDLPIRLDADRNITIPKLTQVPITKFQQFQKIYDTGCKNRRVGATKLNAHSSRSHAILIIQVKHRELKEPYRWLTGKIHLIDLAGSEDNRKTGNEGMRLTESSNINLSLFVLGKVVNALNDGKSLIPYRDSKLTRLLQDSLGGNSQAIMIANIAPGHKHYMDTYNTLNFAMKSKQIVNNPVANTSQFANEAEAKLYQELQRKCYGVEDLDMQSKLAMWKSLKDNPEEKPKRSSTGRTTSASTSSNNTKKRPSDSALQQRPNQRRRYDTTGLSVEELVAKVTQQVLQQQQSQLPQFLSPILRQKKVFSAQDIDRLEAIERRLDAILRDKNGNSSRSKEDDDDYERDEEGEDEEMPVAEQPKSYTPESSPTEAAQTVQAKAPTPNSATGKEPATTKTIAVTNTKRNKRTGRKDDGEDDDGGEYVPEDEVMHDAKPTRRTTRATKKKMAKKSIDDKVREDKMMANSTDSREKAEEEPTKPKQQQHQKAENEATVGKMTRRKTSRGSQQGGEEEETKASDSLPVSANNSSNSNSDQKDTTIARKPTETKGITDKGNKKPNSTSKPIEVIPDSTPSSSPAPLPINRKIAWEEEIIQTLPIGTDKASTTSKIGPQAATEKITTTTVSTTLTSTTPAVTTTMIQTETKVPPTPRTPPSRTSAPSLPSPKVLAATALSPDSSALNHARDCIKKAKKLQKGGKLKEAYHWYTQAQTYLPNNEKLNAKIEQLRKKIAETEGAAAATSTVSTNSASSTDKPRMAQATADSDKENKPIASSSPKPMQQKPQPRATTGAPAVTALQNATATMDNTTNIAKGKASTAGPVAAADKPVEMQPVEKTIHEKLLEYVNNATIKELMKLNMIGQKKAEKLVESRPFASIAEFTSCGVVSATTLPKFLQANTEFFA